MHVQFFCALLDILSDAEMLRCARNQLDLFWSGFMRSRKIGTLYKEHIEESDIVIKVYSQQFDGEHEWTIGWIDIYTCLTRSELMGIGR